MAILRGEWWIDSGGRAQYADGDVGDYNHAMMAFESALGVDLGDVSHPPMVPHESLSPEAIAWLRENGSDEAAIEALADGSDPRDYAVRHMGWIRVKGDDFEVWTLDDQTLRILRRSDIWESADEPEGLEVSNEPLSVEELSGGAYWQMPVSVLLNQNLNAAQVKSWQRVQPGEPAEVGFSVHAWLARNCRWARGS